jgi:hypothetical protein
MSLRKAAAFCFLMGLSGCLSNQDSGAPVAEATGSLSFRIAIAPNSPFKAIAKKAEVEISAPDMASLTRPLQINDSAIEGKVDNIPVGENRAFQVHVYDATDKECYRGSAVAKIKSDSVAIVKIQVNRVVGSAVINGTVNDGGEDTAAAASPFTRDSSTIFLADFNDNLLDRVSGKSGTLAGGKFAAGVYGKSLEFDSARIPKPILRFPDSPLLSVDSGSIEALVNLQGTSPGFMHILDKSWQYGLTVYNGKVAVVFGQTWWYSTYPMPMEKWTYLCGSYDGSTIRLFANGLAVDSAAYHPVQADPSWGLGIGNAFDDGFNIPFLGKIDEIRVSKKSRPAAEISRNWNAIEKALPM